jgi:lipoate-protein ligase A
MVNIANQTIQNYLENLDESTKKKVFHILASRPEDLEKEFFEIKESTVSKLENLLEKESEDDMKQKLVETIQKIKDENYEQVNYIRLKQLEESISQTDS